MRNWTTKEAKCVLNWAHQPIDERIPLEGLAHELGRSVEAVRGFLRRVLPPGQRPWTEKPRWTSYEVEAVLQERPTAPQRSAAAVKKYMQRHCTTTCGSTEEAERASLTVAQIASDLGMSRAAVYRLVNRGILRRFKGRIAETSFSELLRRHPEVIPYSKLPREHKEWLVLNGYHDPSLPVKRPSTKGILD